MRHGADPPDSALRAGRWPALTPRGAPPRCPFASPTRLTARPRPARSSSGWSSRRARCSTWRRPAPAPWPARPTSSSTSPPPGTRPSRGARAASAVRGRGGGGARPVAALAPCACYAGNHWWHMRNTGRPGYSYEIRLAHGGPVLVTWILNRTRSLQTHYLPLSHAFYLRGVCRPSVGVDAAVIIAQACLLYTDNHWWNIQGRVIMTLMSTPSAAQHSARVDIKVIIAPSCIFCATNHC
jgi:hypothetical protein